jgi:hypothetical protein
MNTIFAFPRSKILLFAAAVLISLFPASAQNNSSPGLAPSATPKRPTGTELVPKLEKPADARKLDEKDFAGYLLTYFKDRTHSVYFAISPDGYTFYDVNGGQPVLDGTLLAEQKGVRDPHIARGPDGAFYLVMTDLHIFGQRMGYRDTQWERPVERYGWGNNRAIVLMKSWDLIHWTKSNVRVDRAFEEFSDIGCAWAPEVVHDEKTGKMMVYFTMRMGGIVDCHIYGAYANEDFTKLETTPRRLDDIGGIDGDITRVGDKYHMFFAADSKVRHAVADKIDGDYKSDPNRIDPETVATEAPTLFKRLGTDTYVLMYDVFGMRPNNMGFSETKDFATYENIGRFNEGAMKTVGFESPKHGAVTYLTKDELKAIAAHWKVNIPLD